MATSMKLTVEKVAGSENAADNTSKIKIGLYVTTAGESWNVDGDTEGEILVDGKEAVSLDGKKFYKNSTTTIYSGTQTVKHEEDGTKTVTVKAVFDTKIAAETLTEEKTLQLNSIPRSSVTVPMFTMGEPGTMVITPSAAGAEHEILYTFGSKSGTAVAKTKSTTVTWTPPEDLAEEIPNSASGRGTLTLKSYKGSDVGERTVQFTAWVGADSMPKINSQSVEITNKYNGAALKGRSTLKFSAEASGVYGATIKEQQFVFGSRTVDSLEGEITLNEVGSFTPNWRVTDSRGSVRGAAVRNVSVYNYFAPQLRDPMAYRSTADGEEDESGVHLAVTSGVAYAEVVGNTGHVEMRYRTVGGSWSGWAEVEANQLNVFDGFLENVSYEVELAAVDTVGERKSVKFTIPTAAVTFALGDGGKAAGFGKYPEKEGLDMGWDIHMNGKRVEGLGDPQEAGDAVPLGRLLDLMYPVGSIYMSTAAADPATLFGGMWERIKDTFLLAAGDVYASGDTGGEAEHTLTEEELPSHRHSSNGLPAQMSSGGYVVMRSATMSQQASGASYTDYTGGGTAHNNMPPYLAVNVWKRTA